MQSFKISDHVVPSVPGKPSAQLPVCAALEPFRGLSVRFIHSAEPFDTFIETMMLIALTNRWRVSCGDIFLLVY